jgi:hypothetical protein
MSVIPEGGPASIPSQLQARERGRRSTVRRTPSLAGRPCDALHEAWSRRLHSPRQHRAPEGTWRVCANKRWSSAAAHEPRAERRQNPGCTPLPSLGHPPNAEGRAMSTDSKAALASMRGRIGAYSLHATHDPRVTTRAARAAFHASFEAKADPGGVLPTAERARRAALLRRAHFARLAYRSAVARASTTRHKR